MTILKRVRTTVWETSDGKRFNTRPEAERHEKCFRLAKLLYGEVSELSLEGAEEAANALLSNREGFVIALLPTKEQPK